MERTRVPEGRQNVGDGPDWAKRLCRPSGTVDLSLNCQPSTKVLGYFQWSLRDKLLENPRYNISKRSVSNTTSGRIAMP